MDHNLQISDSIPAPRFLKRSEGSDYNDTSDLWFVTGIILSIILVVFVAKLLATHLLKPTCKRLKLRTKRRRLLFSIVIPRKGTEVVVEGTPIPVAVLTTNYHKTSVNWSEAKVGELTSCSHDQSDLSNLASLRSYEKGLRPLRNQENWPIQPLEQNVTSNEEDNWKDSTVVV